MKLPEAMSPVGSAADALRSRGQRGRFLASSVALGAWFVILLLVALRLL